MKHSAGHGRGGHALRTHCWATQEWPSFLTPGGGGGKGARARSGVGVGVGWGHDQPGRRTKRVLSSQNTQLCSG